MRSIRIIKRYLRRGLRGAAQAGLEESPPHRRPQRATAMARKPTAPETPSAPAGGAVVKAAPGVAVPDGTAPPPPSKKPFWTHLYFQVLLAIAPGALIGHFYPSGVDAAGRPEPGLGE